VSRCYALWIGAGGTRGWTGPHDSTGAARAHVPAAARSVMVVPAPGYPMTAAEKKEAAEILDSDRDAPRDAG
jgi:hypothetical protein